MGTAERTRLRSRPGVLLAVLAAVFGAIIVVPTAFPEPFGLGLVIEAILPWFGVPIGLILLAALARRRWLGTLVALAAAIAWAIVFVPRVLPLAVPAHVSASAQSETAGISLISQNLHGAAGDPESTAREVLHAAPDLVAFQELDGGSREAVDAVLGEHYPYLARAGSVSLWSVYPVSDAEPLDLGLGWNRALRASVAAPGGEVTVYVVHAASARIGEHGPRDRMLGALTALIREDASARILAVGDFNAGTDDRAFAPLASLLTEPRQTSGGFGFTWPEQFPVVRLDHVLARGLTATAASTERLGASDHLGIAAQFVATR